MRPKYLTKIWIFCSLRPMGPKMHQGTPGRVVYLPTISFCVSCRICRDRGRLGRVSGDFLGCRKSSKSPGNPRKRGNPGDLKNFRQGQNFGGKKSTFFDFFKSVQEAFLCRKDVKAHCFALLAVHKRDFPPRRAGFPFFLCVNAGDSPLSHVRGVPPLVIPL